MSRNLRSLAFQYARASSRELAAWDSPYRARWSALTGKDATK